MITILYDKIFDNSLVDSFKIYEKGSFITVQESPIEFIKILISGSAYTNSYSSEGDRAITGILSNLQLFGLIEIFGGSRTNRGNVVCLSKCRILEVSVKDFKKQLSEDKRLSMLCIKYLSEFSLNLIDSTIANRDATTEENILNFLLANSMDRSLPVSIDMSKEFIADLFGINVRTVYRYLNNWENNGYLIRKGNNIIIDKASYQRLVKTCNK